jgi:lipopolysaccharide export system permease protein
LDPDTKPTSALLGSHEPSDIAQLQFRASTPIMALVLTLIAVPLSKLRPRQGRYTRVAFAIFIYIIYFNLLAASKIWIEKSDLPPVIGVWWVHVAALGLGLYLVIRDGKNA